MIFRIKRNTWTHGLLHILWQWRQSLSQQECMTTPFQMCHTYKNTACVTQCWTGWNCLSYIYVARLPWECWSRGLGGGPMPLCPLCLIDSPFIWLKRLSSLMLFSCMLSMGCRRNLTVSKLNHQPLSNEKMILGSCSCKRNTILLGKNKKCI